MTDTPTHNHIRSYVLRGRMTSAQKRFLPILEKFKFEPNTTDPSPFTLDIGSGMGHYICQQAQLNATENFVAAEPNDFCVGSILKLIDEYGLANLRVFQGDAIDLLNQAGHSIKCLQIFFPDPWHKKRHNKRRLVKRELIELLKSKLISGALLHIKTDDAGYASWIREVMSDFSLDFQPTRPPEKITTTKYENRAIKLGNAIHEFAYIWRG